MNKTRLHAGAKEAGLPRTARHTFEGSNSDVLHLNPPWSNFVLPKFGVDVDSLHFLKTQSVSIAELQRGGAQTSINFCSCLETSLTSFARVMLLGISR